jgi:ribonuclease J
MPQTSLRVVPLGGLGEIGRNMMVLDTGDDCLAIDAGVMFPEDEMLGVDLVIPDITYLLERKSRLRGIVITHGHEDHIGALPYLAPQLECPVYATPLAHALIDVKLQEHGIRNQSFLHQVEIGDKVKLGSFEIEWFRVTHSIPDAAGLAIRTPLGLVVHTGDFKVDHTPVDGKAMDLARMAQLGREGVLLLFSDSTYSERPGYTPSEQVVATNLDRIIAEAEGRVIVASFASLISRIQIVLDAAARYGRRVFVFGRSMVDNVEMAVKLGYLHLNPGILGSVEELRRTPPSQTIIMATGSQGEPTSVLSRIANNDHRTIRIIPGDTIIVQPARSRATSGLSPTLSTTSSSKGRVSSTAASPRCTFPAMPGKKR